MKRVIILVFCYVLLSFVPAYACPTCGYDVHTLTIPADFLSGRPLMTMAADPARSVLKSLAHGNPAADIFAGTCGYTAEQRRDLALRVDDPAFIRGVRDRVKASINEYKRQEALARQFRGFVQQVRRPSIAEIVIYQGKMELRFGHGVFDI